MLLQLKSHVGGEHTASMANSAAKYTKHGKVTCTLHLKLSTALTTDGEEHTAGSFFLSTISDENAPTDHLMLASWCALSATAASCATRITEHFIQTKHPDTIISYKRLGTRV
jgi:hypothetical protein